MPLAMVPPGKQVRVERIMAGRALTRRLAEMGLLPGAVVQVCDGRQHGPLLVRLGASRLVLGQGMGMKIMVSEIC